MRRQLLTGYLTIAVLVLLVLELPLGLTFARNEVDRLHTSVERDARVVATFVEEALEDGGPVVLPSTVMSYVSQSRARVLVVDADGISVADTEEGVALGRDYGTRQEIATALAGSVAPGSRYSDTLALDLSFVAVPVDHGEGVIGAVRITYATHEVDERIAANWLRLGIIAVVVLAATAGVGIALSRSVTRPLAEVGAAARKLADGELTTRAEVDQGPPEVREMAAEFNAMAARIEELVDSQRAFVTDASHQLRSPLAALRLELNLLEQDAGPDARDGLARATGEVARLSRLVGALLVLARADRADRELVPVDLAELARDRAQSWRVVAEESDREVTYEGDTSAPALGVPDYLDQVIDNLVDNALRAVPESETVTVRVTAVPVPTLEVVDHGPGMDPEAKRRAFDRFWRGSDQPAGTGTGLGLPIAATLATATGATLELLDTAGGGLTARITLTPP